MKVPMYVKIGTVQSHSVQKTCGRVYELQCIDADRDFLKM